MKNRLGWIFAGTLTCVAIGGAWAAKKEIVAMTGEDLKWVDVPESGGVQVANVSGDVMKTAYSAFAKIPAGQMHPLHTHTSDTKAVVISGTFVLTPEGGVEKKLPAGSYFMVPGGLKHTSGCAAGAPCLLFQQGPAKFDMKPVVEKPAAEKPAAKK
jgi:quercetin dioxygenase-like cupin family protein